MKKLILLSISTLAFANFDATNGYDITTRNIEHPSAYISQMCYTKTKDEQGKAHNPCFACHTKPKEPNPNYEDEKFQSVYNFPAPALKNPFKNLFKDFSSIANKISNKEIEEYVAKDNYLKDGKIILAKKLKHLPKEWDYDKDGKWDGYIPDCYFNFDNEGFDRDNNGNYTGWRAFGYTPFLGTFWPTNGSFDDVLIRLPKIYRQDESGKFNKEVYKINLSVVEAMIKAKDIKIEPIDERKYGVDLNKNGKLDIAKVIKYEWEPNKGIFMSYVGKAKKLFVDGKIKMAARLYPKGTEFLHSVRYIGIKDGKVYFPKRMKELRYAKKTSWLTYANLQNIGMKKLQEKDTDPDNLEVFVGDMERGMHTLGWVYQGLIDDKRGSLLPQSNEETLNCMGCHSGIGATTDTTFAFPRKLDSFKNGWFHWSQKGLKGIKEPKFDNGEYEYTTYLKLNNYGDEFRENSEVKAKFFDKDGKLKDNMIEKLHNDISILLLPSDKRAYNLNRGYMSLVKTQDFIDGKAGHIKPFKNVYKEVKENQETGNKVFLP